MHGSGDAMLPTTRPALRMQMMCVRYSGLPKPAASRKAARRAMGYSCLSHLKSPSCMDRNNPSQSGPLLCVAYRYNRWLIDGAGVCVSFLSTNAFSFFFSLSLRVLENMFSVKARRSNTLLSSAGGGTRFQGCPECALMHYVENY